jgi:broad specificity phosphatase PhoE
VAFQIKEGGSMSVTQRQQERMRMIQELLSEDNNEDNLISWAGTFLGGLSFKDLKEIYERNKERENASDAE